MKELLGPGPKTVSPDPAPPETPARADVGHPQTAPPVRSQSQPRPPVSAGRPGAALLLVYTMWTLIYFEFHNFIPAMIGGGGPVIRRIPLLVMGMLAIVAVMRGSRRSIYWPYALFVLAHMLIVPFAWNRGLAMTGFKSMVLFFIPFVATLSVVRTPAQVLTLYKLFLLSFPWYCIQGLPAGLIWWHNLLGNPDAFGPLGVLAIAIGYNFSLAADERKWKRAGMAIAGLGVIALVASFARGAFLSGVAVVGLIWLRSDRKLRAVVQGSVVLVLLLITSEILFPGGAFWNEMATIAEGTNESTGASRWALWTGVGIPVFLTSPIFGVGANNTGVVGMEIIKLGEVAGRFANPAVLYNKQMHNVYVQLLAEQGLFGVTLWAIMIIGFFRRVGQLRTSRARRAWSLAGGAGFDLKYLSLGLEGAMVGFLVAGVFYNQVYRHWFYTLLLFSFLFSYASRSRVRPNRARESVGVK